MIRLVSRTRIWRSNRGRNMTRRKKVNRNRCALIIFPFVAAVFIHVATAQGEKIEFNRPEIKVPDGYTVQIAAAPPLVKHPLMAGFDDQGRLYIAESAGLNMRRPDLEKELPNFVRRLEDTNGDGRFDKSTIFADKMTLPQGALWYDGALYVAAPPNIWRLEDTDDDGIADKREVIVDEFGYTGNAASVHGCFLGPEGRIYWCDGRHGHEFQTADGKITSKGKAARIFSCERDGSDVRVHCGGGMDNPVEIDFTDEGEMLGTVNLFYRKRGDCLVHWMHGGVYPRYDQQDCIDEFPSTGEPLVEVFNHGHVAVSGTTRYRSTQLGESFRNNFFVTHFNTHKVVRVSLQRDGSTFQATEHDFLESTSSDFHPTDVLEDADGSLLVIDTGGWFRIGCPTSQIAKPNILGAIYRIRKTGGNGVEDPRGLKLAWNDLSNTQLIDLLEDERVAVRSRAQNELVKRCETESLPVFDFRNLNNKIYSDEPAVAAAAMWTRIRIAKETRVKSLASGMSAAIQSDITKNDTLCGQIAAMGAGVLRDSDAVGPLSELLKAKNPMLKRAAATSLGQIGEPSAVPSLLDALAGDLDRVLEHAILYALIEIGDRDATLVGLRHSSPLVRRGALVALDQMEHGDLTRDEVIGLLDTSDVPLQMTALNVISKRPDWGKEIVTFVGQLLDQRQLTDEQRATARGVLLAFQKDTVIQDLITSKMLTKHKTREVHNLLLDVIGLSELSPLPDGWMRILADQLRATNPDTLTHAVAATVALKDGALDERLHAIAAKATHPSALRIAALGSVTGRESSLTESEFEFLASQLDGQIAPMQRLAVARAIGAARLSASQLESVIDLVIKAGPLETPALLSAFARREVAPIGEKLIAAIENSKMLDHVNASDIERIAALLPKPGKDACQRLIRRLEESNAQQRQQLEELTTALSDGDPARGRDVFMNKKASCVACHRVGQTGARTGPDLSTVGARRTKLDLLEAILYPSLSLARGFESYNLVAADGRVITGMITRETASTIFLRTPQQTELKLSRDQIEEITPSRVSIMPAGLHNTIDQQQLSDLVSFLRSLN